MKDGKAVLGSIIRDDNAKPVILGAKDCKYASVLVAEALALKEDVIRAQFMGCKNLVIEGDNLCVINCFKSIWPTPWKIANILKEVEIRLRSFEKISFIHQFRQGKMVVNFLVGKGHRCTYLSRSFESFSTGFFIRMS